MIGVSGEFDKSIQQEIGSTANVMIDMIQLEQVESNYIGSEEARNSSHANMLGGLLIDGSPNTAGNCSIGFSAIDAASNPYIVTAEHCWPKSSGKSIYQGANYVGTLTNKTHYGNEVDAAAIRLSSNNLLSSGVYGYSLRINSAQVPGNDVIGEKVCKSGGYGQNSCGTLLGKNSSSFWDNEVYGKVWFDSLRMANYYSEGGDSGGTVWNPDNRQLKGSHRGTLPNPNGGTPYRIYSHVGNIQKRLGLTPVTWLDK